MTIKGYSLRICTDKSLMALRAIPFVMALIMCLFMKILGKQLHHLRVTSEYKGGLPISDYRVKRRVMIFGTFQVLVLTFLSITLVLLSWDIIRYWRVLAIESEYGDISK